MNQYPEGSWESLAYDKMMSIFNKFSVMYGSKANLGDEISFVAIDDQNGDDVSSVFVKCWTLDNASVLFGISFAPVDTSNVKYIFIVRRTRLVRGGREDTMHILSIGEKKWTEKGSNGAQLSELSEEDQIELDKSLDYLSSPERWGLVKIKD